MSARVRKPTDEVRTEVHDPARRGPVENAAPTYIDRPPEAVPVPAAAERSEPIRVISMKNRPDTDRPRDPERAPLQVKLRSMAEVAGRRNTPAAGLGHLAPPRDPREVRARRMRANVVWACVAIGLACAITLAIWLLAGR
jgi:hypothetical protein